MEGIERHAGSGGEAVVGFQDLSDTHCLGKVSIHLQPLTKSYPVSQSSLHTHLTSKRASDSIFKRVYYAVGNNCSKSGEQKTE